MRASILLDTCATLWIMANEQMRPAAVEAIDIAFDRGEKVRVSPIAGWEIGLLASSGKFKSSHTPERWLGSLLDRPEIMLAEMSPEVLLASSFLPGKPPKDPADRIIAATARQYGLTVMTRDRALLSYSDEGYLSTIEC
ncbi:MAG: type II toxin-antitoxin system VapC family toxin [Alphaproteobacteria bacterium]|nr:type II toxin-antitoxin system VapC family toxin [Alphaproteobacteria bacterium]MDE2110007.1 type II toxin-antitoxin system VapC family toxin [Alphaproteobacteria bacterium]MDE2494932.1 type II toxin-antitoxin system VapC family toxin [Alphaproteobacteria bacterium]